ncbi:MAG: hypothetical protein ACI4QG_05815 [Candidatus Cryptobacteroides sp.]
MAFKLFKNGDDLYNQGDDLIKRGEYAKARDILQKSIDKEGGVDDVAAVKVALIDLSSRLTNPAAYRNLESKLKAVSQKQLEFGLTTFDRDALITECVLTAQKMQIMDATSNDSSKNEAAKQLQDLAVRYQSEIGDRNLIVLEIFKNDTTVTGMTEFYNLMAVSYEYMSDAVVWDNPSQAAEYQQIAMGYRQQNGQSGDANLARIRSYSCTSKCWLCGRVATGEGIHFFSAPADVSPALDKDDNGVAKSKPEGSTQIYICRACYSAVSNRSDEISQDYYNRAMAEMRAMEARLQAEIAALQTQISFARMNR